MASKSSPVRVSMFADQSLGLAENSLMGLQMPELRISDAALASQPISGETTPSVAVIVTTFNDSNYLYDCLRSVLTQTFKDFHCFIVDDGSSEDVSSIVNQAVGGDGRFTLITHTENLGLAAARNTALSICTQDYVQFLDADDLLTPWSIEVRLRALVDAGPNFVGAHGQILQCTEETKLDDVGRWRHNTPVSDRDFISSQGESPFTVHAPLTQRDILVQIGGFDESFKNGAEDWELWSRLLRTGATFRGVNRVVGAYRQRSGSMIRAHRELHLSRADTLLSRAGMQAYWSDGRPAPMFHSLPDHVNLLSRSRRIVMWSGIDFALEVLSDIRPQVLDVELDRTSAEVCNPKIAQELEQAARRGIIRGFGLSVHCVDRLTAESREKIELAARTIALQFLVAEAEKVPTQKDMGESGGLVLDLGLPSFDVVVAISKPGDSELVRSEYCRQGTPLILDLGSASGDGFEARAIAEDFGLQTASISEFLLRQDASADKQIVILASAPVHPFLRTLDTLERFRVIEVDVHGEELQPDIIPDVPPVDYRCLISKEESTLDAESTLRLDGLHNAYHGATCVVVGNGPSLNQIDLSEVARVPYFAVNSFFLMEERIARRPDFYVVEDTAVFKENFEDIIKFEAGLKFFPSIYKERIQSEGGVETQADSLFFRMNQGFYGRSTGTLAYPRFSLDPPRRLYCGQSVTIINLQIAHWLGFKRVLLVGMDFSYTIPESSIVEGNLIRSREDDPNHFDPRYFGEGKTWKDPKLHRVLQNYYLAKMVFERSGREIINCTIGGNLELFERGCLADYV